MFRSNQCARVRVSNVKARLHVPTVIQKTPDPRARLDVNLGASKSGRFAECTDSACHGRSHGRALGFLSFFFLQIMSSRSTVLSQKNQRVVWVQIDTTVAGEEAQHQHLSC